MQLADAPVKIVEPFAAGGSKNTIPVPDPGTPGAASWTLGFPPATMIDPADGGIGPSGLDFNGIYFAISALSRWFNSGAGFAYDAAFSATVGGYPRGSRVLQASGSGYWLSIVDNNVTNPDTGGAGWIPQAGKTTSSVYASAQQTLAVGAPKILFDTVEFDSGFWDATHKRFVALYPGKYRMSGSVTLIAPGGQSLFTQIWTNGSLTKQCCAVPQVSDQNLSLPLEATVNLAVGDFLEAFMGVTQTPVLAGVVGSNEALVYAQLEYLGI